MTTIQFRLLPTIAVLTVALTPSSAWADKVPVTEKNYKIAESDLAFQNITKLVGSNKWFHFPGLTPLITRPLSG